MARGVQGAIMRGFGARDHRATVLSRTELTEHCVRLGFHCPEVMAELDLGPAAWLRFWFPDAAGGDMEYQRAYTLVDVDPDAGTFTIDVMLHEPSGPAAAWAARARPGDAVAVMTLGATRFTLSDEPPAGYLLLGDSASLPGIRSILAEIPADVPVEVYLEEHDPADRGLPVGEHPRLRLHWVPRTGDGALAAAIEERDWSDWKAWASPEAGTLKLLTKRLRDEFGFPKSEVYARAYWSHGKAMGQQRGDAGSAAVESTVVPGVKAADTGPGAAVPRAASTPSRRPGRWSSQGAGDLLRPLRPALILAGVLQAAISIVQLTPYVLLVELARLLLSGASSERMITVGVAAIVIIGVGSVLGAALMFALHLVDARFSRDLRRRLVDKIVRIPLGWFTRRGSSGVTSVVRDDTLSLHYLVTHAVPDAVAAVITPLLVLGYLFVVDVPLGLIMLIPILVYLINFYIMIIASGAKIGQAQRWAERMGAEAAGFLDGQSVIRVFGGAAASSFRARLDEYHRFLSDWQRPFIGRKTFLDVATRPSTFLWLIAVGGVLRIAVGSMPPIDLLPFLLLGTTFGARLLGLGYGLSGLQAGMVGARSIAGVLAEPELATAAPRVTGAAARRHEEAPDDHGGRDAGDHGAGDHGNGRGNGELSRTTVEFCDVGFAYRPGIPVLEGIALTLRPGTVTALVGPSGSGKSTLAGLLARFHDVGSGSIRLDGVDVRDLSTDELYRRIGFVWQDPQIVQGTVHDNIALGQPDATRDEVREAACAAQLADRIERLPQGYDTVVGGDTGLSGGERQRLTIARALLADPAVLILDEATAYADPEAEHLVQQALDRLTRDRTVLVVAHRLYTVTGADQIVVLDGGRITQVGRHADLLAQPGRYRQLWAAAHHTGVDTAAEHAADRHVPADNRASQEALA